jgi:uncharacterized metal-binding protein
MCGQSSCCSGGPTLIFACSGAADVGEIADRTGRNLTKEKTGQMFCLAGIGGRVEPIMKKTKSASKVLAIDGCELDCAKNLLEQAGFTKFKHLRLTDLGLKKGQSPVNEQNIDLVVETGKKLLA